MFEVTREKLEKAIEEEKEITRKYEKKLARFIICFGVLGAIELIFLLALPPVDGFLALIAVVAFDFILLVMSIAFFTWQEIGIFSPWLVINSINETEFSKKLKTLDDVSKIQLLEQRVKTAKGILRTNAIASLVPLYTRRDEAEKMKALTDYMISTNPKSKFGKNLRTDIMLSYYDYTDDVENYIKVFEENLHEFTDMWENGKINYKVAAMGRQIIYLIHTNEYK